MSRPLRIEFENAYYHVSCRGNDRCRIFRDDEDRLAFLQHLGRSAEMYGVRLLCFTLMDNHFHLVLRTPLANLSQFMRRFNVSYTMAFNRRHHRSGHLYQGRYHAVVVDRDSYLLEVSRYVHLNPIRTRAMAEKNVGQKTAFLARYSWSSYGGYIALRRRHQFVDYSEVLDLFGGDTPASRKRYGAFVEEGITARIENPFERAVGRLILGGEQFVERVRGYLDKAQQVRELPALRPLSWDADAELALEIAAESVGVPAEHLVSRGHASVERALAMEALYRHLGVSQAKIGMMFGGIDYSTVSVIRKNILGRLEEDKQLRSAFARITSALDGNKFKK